jgi:hypothetical protein
MQQPPNLPGRIRRGNFLDARLLHFSGETLLDASAFDAYRH